MPRSSLLPDNLAKSETSDSMRQALISTSFGHKITDSLRMEKGPKGLKELEGLEGLKEREGLEGLADPALICFQIQHQL